MHSPTSWCSSNQKGSIRVTYSGKITNNSEKKPNAEKVKLQFIHNNSLAYNKLFPLPELMDSIKISHRTDFGPDEILYQFLKQLPKESMIYFQEVYNHTWISKKSQDIWKQITVISIPKNRTEYTNLDKYCPIVLTSCLNKIMQCMISNKLTRFLEPNGIITNIQSGFRKRRGIIAHWSV